MAFTVTSRGFSKGAYAATATVGSAFTPAENDIVIMFNVCNGTASHTSVTGWSATWVELVAPTTTTLNVSVWAARIGASPGSGQPTIDFAAASDSYTAGVLQISGAHTTLSVATGTGNLFRQAQTSENYNPASPMAITALSAYASATNLSLTLGAISSNLPLAPKSGFTEVLESSGAGYNPNVWAAYRTSEDTAHQVLEQTAGDFDYKTVAGVAFEIVEAAGGGATNANLLNGKLAGLLGGKL